MAISRYNFVRRLPEGVSISSANFLIFNAASNGTLKTQNIVLEEGRRLDQLAGENYGDGAYWWVIAAASGIGWGLQVPAGTLVRIPVSLEAAIGLIV
jgi:hypothetical protein